VYVAKQKAEGIDLKDLIIIELANAKVMHMEQNITLWNLSKVFQIDKQFHTICMSMLGGGTPALLGHTNELMHHTYALVVCGTSASANNPMKQIYSVSSTTALRLM
jgi:1-aminocyclopropane-1-carboxylate deaminase/D-cysteine desulfhydrase-like pyridoxal-dependent ACC family enzyme